MKKLTEQDFIINYSKILEAIEKESPSYPSDYQGITKKSKILIDNLNFFEGSNLIDIGSNFGMYTLLASRYCNSVVGIERELNVYKSSLSVKSMLLQEGFELENVNFLNEVVSTYISQEVEADAALMSLILYHLTDVEVGILKEFLTKKCTRVIIQARPGRQAKFDGGILKDFVSNHKEYDGLFSVSGNIEFLEDCGFKKIDTIYLEELFYGEDFPVIIASK